MSIFVKYCGGCNPVYNRGVFVKALLTRANWQTTSNPESADICLLVQGCARHCVQKTQDYQRTIVIDNNATIDDVLQSIQEELS